MSNYTIDPAVNAALAAFKLPEKLGFGIVLAPVMYSVEWADGHWGKGALVPYGPIEIAPGDATGWCTPTAGSGWRSPGA